MIKDENLIQVGKVNRLTVHRKVDFGFYLGTNCSDEEVLIPKRYIEQNLSIGDKINVFVYLDSEDRIIATTETPHATVDQFAFLKVVSINSVGAFLDWGLPKDILLPYREQILNLEIDQFYLVRIYLDTYTNRIVASMRLLKFLDQEYPNFEQDDEVNLIIWSSSEIGYKVIINQQFSGLIHHVDIFQNLKSGQHLKGYIKKIRDDKKIDISLQKFGYKKVGDFSDKLLEYIRKNSGYINLHDKSSPKLIYKTFAVSKATFKKAIGKLYKYRLIDIEADGIYLREK